MEVIKALITISLLMFCFYGIYCFAGILPLMILTGFTIIAIMNDKDEDDEEDYK